MGTLDGDPEADLREQLDVVLAVAEGHDVRKVDSEQPRDEGDPGSLRRSRVPELEEVRQRGRDEEAVVERALEVEPHLGEALRLGDRDELRRRPVEPGEEVADLRDSQPLEARVRARVRGLLGDVEPVVDVDVRREAVGEQRRDRLARDLELERLVEKELARPGIHDRSALVADDRLARFRPARRTARRSGTCARSRSARECRPPVPARSLRACAAGGARRDR